MDNTVFADPVALSAVLDPQPYRAALPGMLDDHWLYALLNDFRHAEAHPEREFNARVAGPMVAMLHLATGRNLEVNGKASLKLDYDQLGRIAYLYQFYLERELVRRVLGTVVIKDEELLKELDAELR